MLTTLMGAGVFSVGFFMLILGLIDLLRLGGLNFGLGDRILLYVGGLFLCVLGYIMARRLPRAGMREMPIDFPQSDVTSSSDEPL
ncbi:MAG: hypothetical protein BroJett039_13390 [Chloroflexota bacterium]|nr:MAG: hypothetical protein BroJett039_13390 [Chloroflexota bacterium]